MLAASGWWQPATRSVSPLPLYDPCCGSGTIVIEAAQLALGLPAAGSALCLRAPQAFDAARGTLLKQKLLALSVKRPSDANRRPRIFGSDVAHRMVDFAQRNAARAGVAAAVELRGGDALQRQPPCRALACCC
jgi:putative N6-adenine-specific DNA methylase